MRETGRPLVVTANGRTEAVVPSPAAFDARVEDSELRGCVTVLRKSFGDIEAGRTLPADEAFASTRRRPGAMLRARSDAPSS